MPKKYKKTYNKLKLIKKAIGRLKCPPTRVVPNKKDKVLEELKDKVLEELKDKVLEELKDKEKEDE